MKYMTIALYRIEKGERVSDTATIDYTVTNIAIKDEHYEITSRDIWTGKDEIWTVPTAKYEIVINKFN